MLQTASGTEQDVGTGTDGDSTACKPPRRRRILVWSSALVLALLGTVAVRAATHTPAACTQETPPDSAFVVIGDFGGGEAQADVASAIGDWAEGEHPIEAIATSGDNVNPCGDPSEFEAHLVEPYKTINAPMWATLGNRDVQNGDGDAQIDFLGLPDLPYAKDLDGVQLLFLDSTEIDSRQTEWLDSTLSGPGPPLRAVFFHHPAYSCGYNGATSDVLEHWVPVLERHGVAAVFSGHDHYYERFVSPADVNYVVTGGGGMYLLDIGDDCTPGAERVRSESAHHFMYAEVRGSKLTLRSVGTDGQTIDEFEVTR